MPTVSVYKKDLFKLLGKQYADREFDDLCFDFGVEIDEDTTAEALKAGTEPELKIDIGANRYDLLCIEGIAQSLNEYVGNCKSPDYKLTKPTTKLVIDKSTEQIRPYAAAAILKNIHFDAKSYESFIGLQDKLHSNICRNRTLVAIGTHDLDTIEGPFSYKALPRDEFSFIPLNQSKKMTGKEIIDFYNTPEQKNNLGKFTHIIQDSPVYPVVLDAKDTVCSMPPIINSEHSKISLDTKNVFIEVTAKDRTKAEIVLNQIVAMFSRYCDEKFTVEPVEIVSEHNGESRVTPNFDFRHMQVSKKYINGALGLKLSSEEIAKYLEKMSLRVNKSASADDDVLDVSIPITRSDILHPCDIMEDTGIAYGFNNLPKDGELSNSSFVGTPLPINKVADFFRIASSQAGWTEVLPLTLCSHDENFKFLRQEDDCTVAVKLANPKTAEYQVVRTTLLSGILKTVRENRKHSLPIKVFETGDVVFKNDKLERKAFNEKHWAAIYVGKSSGFEIIQGLLAKIMQTFRTPWIEGFGSSSPARGYWIEEDANNTYFPGRGAKVMFRSKEGGAAVKIGHLGALHPEVLINFEVPYAASYVELNCEVFL